MTLRSLLRFAIQVIRLTLLPFPAAFFISMLALQVTDQILHPDRTHFESGEPGEEIGGFILYAFAAMLQIIVGVPSLLALDSANGGIRRYLATVVTIAVILSLLVAGMFHSPQLGETFGWMSTRVLIFLGVPLVYCYLLALYLRMRRDQIA